MLLNLIIYLFENVRFKACKIQNSIRMSLSERGWRHMCLPLVIAASPGATRWAVDGSLIRKLLEKRADSILIFLNARCGNLSLKNRRGIDGFRRGVRTMIFLVRELFYIPPHQDHLLETVRYY